MALVQEWSQVRATRTAPAAQLGHFTGQNLWFAAPAAVTLARVFALEFTTPLWVSSSRRSFWGNASPDWRLSAVLGFLGILW